MNLTRIFQSILIIGLMILGLVGTALAAQPEPWQMNFQPAVTPVMEEIVSFHNALLWLITAIAGFVMILLLYVFVRFNARANPEPNKFSHNTLLEVVWTAVPVVILVLIAMPSLRLLYLQDVIPPADFTIKATGHQWYWSYQYPDHGGFEYFANMVADEDLQEGQPRLLATDASVVVPVGATVRVVVTASDVLHSWAMPSFGIKMDAVPGRLNETWFQVFEEGTYYGQCSELCGSRHAFMPIQVEVVSQDEFDIWIAEQGGTAMLPTDVQSEPLDVATATQN